MIAFELKILLYIEYIHVLRVEREEKLFYAEPAIKATLGQHNRPFRV